MNFNQRALHLILGSLLTLWSCSAQAPTTEKPTPPEPHQGMVRIPEGAFIYGADEQQINFYVGASLVNFPGMVEAIRESFVNPPQTQTLPEYWIGEFETSNGEFKTFLDATGYQPQNDTDYLQDWTANHHPNWATDFPVVWVSVDDARAYCQWRGGRLPSEMEWEKAARGATGVPFAWGTGNLSRETANFGTGKIEPTGNRPQDRSPYGVYDLAGNVAELTAGIVVINSVEHVVVRGGSFANPGRDTLATYRDLSSTLSSRRASVGFRCVAAP